MGLFWDLVQQGQMSEQADKATTLERRVAQLGQEVLETRRLLLSALERLETHLRIDLDQNGRVGP